MASVAQLQPSVTSRARPPLWREAVGMYPRRTRTEQNRILSDVATTAGVSTQSLSEVERGLKEPSSEILAAVVGALGLTLLDMTLGVGAQLQQEHAERQHRVLTLRSLTHNRDERADGVPESIMGGPAS